MGERRLSNQPGCGTGWKLLQGGEGAGVPGVHCRPLFPQLKLTVIADAGRLHAIPLPAGRRVQALVDAVVKRGKFRWLRGARGLPAA